MNSKLIYKCPENLEDGKPFIYIAFKGPRTGESVIVRFDETYHVSIVKKDPRTSTGYCYSSVLPAAVHVGDTISLTSLHMAPAFVTEHALERQLGEDPLTVEVLSAYNGPRVSSMPTGTTFDPFLPHVGKLADDPLYRMACRLAMDAAKNSKAPPQLLVAPIYFGLTDFREKGNDAFLPEPPSEFAHGPLRTHCG